MADFVVTFLPTRRSVTIAEGASVLEAASAAGLRLYTPCGGQGQCGKCVVEVTRGVGEPSSLEERVLGTADLAQGRRLACQTRVVGDTEVAVPSSSTIAEHRIAVEGAGREVLMEPNIRKVSLRLALPSADDPRPDMVRVLDALGGEVRPPRSAGPFLTAPGVLRAADYELTAVIAGNRLLCLEPGDTSDAVYGAAVDIGTTTVVVYLVHLATGEVAAVTSGLNPQSRYGGDVISRLTLAISETDGASRLAAAIRESVNELIIGAAKQAEVRPDAIYEIVVVGNTCMTHFFLGIPPSGLAGVPFVPAFQASLEVGAAEVGVEVNPEAVVFVTPSIGGFVGADTVGVILASELDRADALRVAADIGTNGEIVVGRDGELYACSTAAGPAFEGARISRGMRAASGAIDAVRIAEDVECRVIGGGLARGICGSGLVDAVAELVRAGLVSETGRMGCPEAADALPEKVRRRLIENEQGMSFVLVWGEQTADGSAITLTAGDVRELQLAKAAICAGVTSLLEEFGATSGAIERLVMAGAFGNYISRESAQAIGLIPAIDLSRVESIGNAAGVGARLVLSSVSERRRAQEIAVHVQHVDLSKSQAFYDHFADAMMLRPMAADR